MRAAIWTLCLASGLCGQQAQEHFTSIEGEEFQAHLETLIDGVTLRIEQDGRTRTLLLDQLVRWRPIEFTEDPAPPPPPAGMLRTRSGMQLACEFLGADDQRIRLNIPPCLAPVSFTLRHLASLRLVAEVAEDGGFTRAQDQAPDSNDLLFAVNRDTGKITRLSVTVQSFTEGSLQVMFRDQPQTVPIDQVYGLILAGDLGAPPDPQPRPTVRLHFANGQTAKGRLTEWDGETCSLFLAEGATLRMPCTSIRQISVQSSRLMYLSELEPKAEQVPAFDRIRPWLRDSAPLGKGLLLDGRSYAHGLCLIPHTRLTFALDGTFGFFAAIVGIDDRSSREADADIRIYADDRLVFEATGMRHGEPGRSVRIPLAGLERLILEADFGKNFDLGDHCLFADARLLKE